MASESVANEAEQSPFGLEELLLKTAASGRHLIEQGLIMTDGLMLIGALRPGSDTTLSWNKDRCLNQFSRPKLLNLTR